MNRENLKKMLVISVLIITIIVLASLFIYNRNRQELIELANTKRITVEKKDLKKLVITNGKFVSQNERQVMSPLNGKIKEIKFQSNDKVNKDDVVIIIELTDERGRTSDQEIKSPINGRVTNLQVQTEDLVLAGQSPLFKVTNLSDLEIEANITESDIDEVVKDQKVEITISALDDKRISGVVSFIALTPVQTNTELSTYKIKIQPETIPAQVKIGMSCDLEIITQTKQNILTIPDTYTYKKDSKTFVKTFRKNGDNIDVNEVEIKTGFKTETDIEITSGLSEGDEIILPTEEIEANSDSGFSPFGN
jgi:HlyD family secretion protein